MRRERRKKQEVMCVDVALLFPCVLCCQYGYGTGGSVLVILTRLC